MYNISYNYEGGKAYVKNKMPKYTVQKNFKKGKGLIGGAVGTAIGGPLVGAVGLATGFNGKKKVKFVCQKCGKVFEVKI